MYCCRLAAFLRRQLVGVALVFAGPVIAAGVDVPGRGITVPIYQEPRILDSTSAPTVEFTAEVLAHIQEGLLRLDGKRRLAPGVAESWEMSDTTLRFRLRKDARWANGAPVTAHDFVFAWRTLVTPATGSQSANLASPFRNALAIMRGEAAPASLGVRAVSDHELEAALAHPCGWCVKMMTSAAFYPVSQEFFEAAGGEFGTSAETHLANGPFLLSSWQRGKSLTLRKTPEYWGRERVHLNTVHYGYLANDAKSLLNLYRSGDVALVSLDRDTVAAGMSLGQRIHTMPTGYLMHLQFSHRPERASADENMRKAIAAVVDKEDLVNRVIGSPGTRVANTMFHHWMSVGDTTIGKTLSPKPHEPDLAAARRYLAAAKETLGKQSITLTFTIFDNGVSRRLAEYLQQRLALIGVDLKIDPQTVQVLLDKWFKGQGDLFLIGWIADVDDPIDQLSFLGNPDIREFFRGFYEGSDMTEIYFRYRDATDAQTRIRVVEDAQAFFEKRVTVMPLYESYSALLIDPRVKGYVFQPVRAFNDYRYVQLREVRR